MKRLARFFRILPETQRELFALPRWWMILLGLLAMVPPAVVTVGEYPLSRADFGTVCESTYLVAMMLALGVGLARGFLFARQEAEKSRLQTNRPFWRILGLLFAVMAQVYVVIFALVPFAIGFSIYLWDGDFTYEAFCALIFMECVSLSCASLGLLLGVIWQRERTFLSAIPFICFAFCVVELLEISIWIVPVRLQIYNILRFGGSTTTHSWMLLGFGGVSLLNTGICFAVLHNILQNRSGFLFSRILYMGIGLLWGAKYALLRFSEKNIHSGNYFIWILPFLLLSPFFLTPGHRPMREREWRLRSASLWKRLFSPYASAYAPLLVATVLFVLPVLWGWLEKDNNLVAGMRVGLPLIYTWACLITALVEHCTLYVARRGRLLAFLVGCLFLFVPHILSAALLGESHKVTYAVSPFVWFNRNLADVPYFSLTVQFCTVGGGAFLLQLWTDHQRRKLAAAQRKRIEEVLALGS